MKVESEPVVCHSNASPKFVAKSFECDNDALGFGGMILEDQKELTSPLKGNEDTEQLLHDDIAADGWVATKSLGLDDFNDYGEVKVFASPPTNSSKAELFEEDSELYMEEKSIVECQLPELIVCYTENICNIVKDICIDEGVPSRDKLLCGNSLDEKAVGAILPPEGDWEDELERALEKRDVFASDDSEHSESFGKKDSPEQCDSNDFAGIPEAEYDVAYFTDNDIPNLSMTDLVAESVEPLINNKNEHEPHPQSEHVFVESTSLEVPVLACVAEESYSSPEEAISASTTSAPAPEEPKDSGSVNDISYNSKVDNGNITFDFNSLASTARDEMERCDNGDLNSSAPMTSSSVNSQDTSSSSPLASANKCQVQCHDTSSNPNRMQYEDLSKAEVGSSDRHPVSSQVQHGLGETSFSSIVPLGSLMSNSGRIGYSGSISLRSDSSTTSTRSFAFPVLQTEWNSSPVRMAKADRRHLRKHRCWKQGLLCCRF